MPPSLTIAQARKRLCPRAAARQPRTAASPLRSTPAARPSSEGDVGPPPPLGPLPLLQLLSPPLPLLPVPKLLLGGLTAAGSSDATSKGITTVRWRRGGCRADHRPIRTGEERGLLVTASPVMTKSRGPSWGRNNYPENGLVNPPRRETRALSPAGMFGEKALPRLAAQKSRPHAHLRPMRGTPAYFLCK